eukprot:756256-Hanusia_phi.AAC.4
MACRGLKEIQPEGPPRPSGFNELGECEEEGRAESEDEWRSPLLAATPSRDDAWSTSQALLRCRTR